MIDHHTGSNESELNFLEKFRVYYQLFGWQGLGLGIKTRLLRKPAEVTVRVPLIAHPVHLRLKTSDVPTLQKIFKELDYDFPMAKPPAVIIDAGANIGLASIYFAQKFPSARIIAIEPETSNFELLQKNVRPYSNVVPVNAALWKQNTLINVVDPGIGPWGFQAHDSNAAEGVRVVATIQGRTLDSLMTEYGIQFIDLLKIDIEGGEFELFEDPRLWIGKVGAIMIELHDRIRMGCTDRFNLATKDFKDQQCKGENVFVARVGA